MKGMMCNMRKKICFLYHNIFSLGGIQRSVSCLSNSLIKNGYDVTIICANSNPPLDYDIYNLSHDVNVEFITISTFERYLLFWTKIIYFLM